MGEKMDFKRFGLMIDNSRNAVMNIPTVKKYIDMISDLGYSMLMLYTEDTYEVDNQPYFGYLRGRYSRAELKEIDAYASSNGIELIPCIQTLAHLQPIFHWRKYRDIRDCEDILIAGDEGTYELVDDMFKSLADSFTSRIVNVGMDEAALVGRGKYINKFGVRDRFEILVNHLKRISEIADKYGFKLLMWGDMFYRIATGGEYYSEGVHITDEIRSKIPENVDIIYWDYYSLDKKHYDTFIKSHNKIKNNAWFAGGIWTWNGFAPHNQFSIDSTKAALEACNENKVENVFMTIWGDDGGECSRFSSLPALYYSAEIAKGNTDEESIKKGFEEKFGIPYDIFMLTDLPGTGHATPNKHCNPDKYMLYNDPLLGMFDKSLVAGEKEGFAECAKKLHTAAENKEYGYIFKTLATLCDAVSAKYDLGLRTRNAYQKGDKAALKAMLVEYDDVINKLEVFSDAFRAQWISENKPHGFDLQDIRIGGLLKREKYAREFIEKYVSDEIDAIPELDEKILPFGGINSEAPFCFNIWQRTATVNPIYP